MRGMMMKTGLGKSPCGTGAPKRNALASRAGLWHGTAMSNGPSDSPPSAGGAFIALAIFIGFTIGYFAHQPTIGVLAGMAAGAVAALLLWLKDRRR